MIDTIKGIPKPLFETMALSLKRVCSAGLLKVVFVVSNGPSAAMVEENTDIQSRTMAKHRIENEFSEDDIKKYLQKTNKKIDIYSPKLLTKIRRKLLIPEPIALDPLDPYISIKACDLYFAFFDVGI